MSAAVRGKAIYRGALIPEYTIGIGVVLGVFSSAAAFRFGDYAITISENAADSPLGIEVDAVPLALLRAHVGASVQVQDRVMLIGGDVWSIDVAAAVPWPGQRVESLEIAASAMPKTLILSEKTVAAFLRGERREIGFSGLLCFSGEEWRFRDSGNAGILFAALPPIRLFEKGFIACDGALCRAAAERLLGLGPGLTPSGDDFLVGLLAVLGSVMAGETRSTFYNDLLQELCTIPAGRTNPYGGSLFRCVVAGYAPSAVVTAIRSLLRDDDAIASLRRLADIGGSSGVDALAGVMFGVSLMGRACRERL